jgi:hypothetical protein
MVRGIQPKLGSRRQKTGIEAKEQRNGKREAHMLTCNKGCPATTLKNLSKPSLLLSITSSLNLFVNTFPGRGGIFTLVDSRSRISRKASKSE